MACLTSFRIRTLLLALLLVSRKGLSAGYCAWENSWNRCVRVANPGTGMRQVSVASHCHYFWSWVFRSLGQSAYTSFNRETSISAVGQMPHVGLIGPSSWICLLFALSCSLVILGICWSPLLFFHLDSLGAELLAKPTGLYFLRPRRKS